MEQPWPQPQESMPDPGDLPLAGLLAELLAASEAESAPPPADDPVAALAQPAGWPESGPEASLDAPQVLRALDEAAPAIESLDSDNLSGMLLARLIGNGEPEAGFETSSGAPDERTPAASGTEESMEMECAGPDRGGAGTPAAVEAELAQPEAPGRDLSAALLDRLMGEGQSGIAEETAGVDAGEPQIPPPGGSAGAAPPAADSDAPGTGPEPFREEEAWAPAVESPSLVQDGWRQTEHALAGPAADDPAASELPEPAAAGPAQADAGWTGPAGDAAGQDVTTAGEAASIPEAGPVEPAEETGVWGGQNAAAGAEDGAATARLEPPEVPAAARVAEDSTDHPGPRPSVGSSGDEDEFELVDAAQAERMLDRLLDAARSAVRSTQAPAARGAPAGSAPAAPFRPEQAGGDGAGEPRSLPDAAVSREPAGVLPAQASEAGSAGPRAPSGEPGAQEAPPRRAAEERAMEVSPIPPAAALMALGLPERLRARLESLGDVEQILHGQQALEPAPERKPRLLVFRAGGESYALSMGCVREVERVNRVTPVPGAPQFVRGMVNLRGEILPLLDLAALFGRTGEPTAPRLIVAQASPADPVVALLVEELNGLAPFDEGGVEPPPQPGPMQGSLEHRGRRVWWIDPVAVFGAEALEKAAGEGQPGGMEESA